MKHAKSHTYHKHGLGYAVWEGDGRGRYYNNLLKYSTTIDKLI